MKDFESEPLLIEESELSQNVKVSPIKSDDVPKNLPPAQPRFTWSDKQSLILITLFVTFAALANLIRFFWNIPIAIGTTIFLAVDVSPRFKVILILIDP